MQLLQEYSTARSNNDKHGAIAALPAGRIAAANFAGIDVLELQMASSEAAPTGTECRPTCATKTVLSKADSLAWYAPGRIVQGLTATVLATREL